MGAERGRLQLEELSQNTSRSGKMLSFSVNRNLWQTWKAIVPFQLLVTDLKSAMRRYTGGAPFATTMKNPPAFGQTSKDELHFVHFQVGIC